jgi:hypothetical protein
MQVDATPHVPSRLSWHGLPTGNTGWQSLPSSGQNCPFGHFGGRSGESLGYPNGKSSDLQRFDSQTPLSEQKVTELHSSQNCSVPTWSLLLPTLQRCPFPRFPASTAGYNRNQKRVRRNGCMKNAVNWFPQSKSIGLIAEWSEFG